MNIWEIERPWMTIGSLKRAMVDLANAGHKKHRVPRKKKKHLKKGIPKGNGIWDKI